MRHYRWFNRVTSEERTPIGLVGAIGETSWLGRLFHLVHETPEGCVMRSRFWLGESDPVQSRKPPPEVLKEKVPDAFGSGLFAHCCEK